MQPTMASIELATSASSYVQQHPRRLDEQHADSMEVASPATPTTLEEIICVEATLSCGTVSRGNSKDDESHNLSSSSTTTADDSAIFGSDECSNGVITPSRRDSNAIHGLKDYIRGRRHTINKAPVIRRYNGGKAVFSALSSPRKDSGNSGEPSSERSSKKPSVDSQFLDYDSDEEGTFHVEGVYGRTAYHRRFSVPEKTLRKANYAILRKSIDEQFEIIGAFQKCNISAYKEFLQSLSCYDLAPPHGIVVVFDFRLQIHKAVTIMCLNPNNKAAIVCKAGNRVDDIGIFTITDCLYVLKLASTGNMEGENIGEKTLQYYLENLQPRKQLITASTSMTAWDVARLFRLNRVHRIPVLQFNKSLNQPPANHYNEVFSFVCLRSLFIEILKLLDSKCALVPDLHSLTLEKSRLGNWENIASIEEGATLKETVGQFLDSKAPCLPLLRSTSPRELIGVVTKSQVIEALAEKSGDYLEALELPIKSVIQLEGTRREMSIESQCTIEFTIRRMVHEYKTCLFIANGTCLEGVVSLADIMDFLLSSTGI